MKIKITDNEPMANDMVEVTNCYRLGYHQLSLGVREKYKIAYEKRELIKWEVGKRGLVVDTFYDYISVTPRLYVLVDFTSSGIGLPVLLKATEVEVFMTARSIKEIAEIINPPHYKILEDWLDSLDIQPAS